MVTADADATAERARAPAASLVHKAGRMALPGRPLLMGILNVTPDSFSDGGRHQTLDKAVAHAETMVAEGADLIDVGGESTRPGARAVPVAEEVRRVVPIIEALVARDLGVPISIDTRRAETARAALDAGAVIVNDVSALADPDMARVVAEQEAGLVLMHMQGEPGTMQAAPHYDDVVGEVLAFLASRVDAAVASGVDRAHIILDPGIGFGKRTGEGVEDNCALLEALPRFVATGQPVMVGASRKRFIGSLTGASVANRLPGSLVAAAAAVWGGASVLRVHDVRATLQAVQVAAALDPSAWRHAWRPAWA